MPPSSVLIGGALSWLGILICFLLWQQHAGLQTLLCPVRASCDAVLNSPYASVFGIPLPLIGAGFYTAMLVVFLGIYGTRSKILRLRLLNSAHWMAIAGLTFSAGLMILQFGVLRAFCPLCTMSALVMGGLLVAATRAASAAGQRDWNSSPLVAVTLALFAIFPTIILLTSNFSAKDDVLAEVGGQRFTRREMEAELRVPLAAVQRTSYALESKWVRERVEQALLARKAADLHTTAEELLASRLKTAAVPADDEVAARLANLKLADSPENLASVREGLLAERRRSAKEALLKDLEETYKVQIYLEQPRLVALQIDPVSAHLTGPQGAKVQVVVFSDFQCPFCRELAPVLKRVREQFSKDVAFGFRHFPIRSHDRAMPTAIAAECAAEENKFWEYHDLLFEKGGDLSDAKILALAGAAGLDTARFAECLKSPKPRQQAESSLRDALEAGLEGAPAVFINGLRVEGDLDYDNLVRHVKDALNAHPVGGTSATQP